MLNYFIIYCKFQEQYQVLEGTRRGSDKETGAIEDKEMKSSETRNEKKLVWSVRGRVYESYEKETYSKPMEELHEVEPTVESLLKRLMEQTLPGG